MIDARCSVDATRAVETLFRRHRALSWSRVCRSSAAERRRRDEFQTATVTRGPITQAVTATGTLNPVVNVQVGSQVSGNIQKLFVDFNSKVKAGQVVAQIDPALFQATVTQAEGDLASAQAGAGTGAG